MALPRPDVVARGQSDCIARGRLELGDGELLAAAAVHLGELLAARAVVALEHVRADGRPVVAGRRPAHNERVARAVLQFRRHRRVRGTGLRAELDHGRLFHLDLVR